jgi:hypothetical protein
MQILSQQDAAEVIHPFQALGRQMELLTVLYYDGDWVRRESQSEIAQERT